MLLKYKRSLDEERSDSDDFSLNWLVWILAVTTVFNFIDLVRLNFQQVIPYELNILGQGINNAIWLVVTMIIIIKSHNCCSSNTTIYSKYQLSITIGINII